MQKANQRLLIVDDDKQIRELLAFDITQSGYSVDCAQDGEEGLKKALENNYDLILLRQFRIQNLRIVVDAKYRNMIKKST